MVSFNAIRILATIAALASAAATGADANPNVHPSVHRTLRAQGTVNLIVTLKADTSSVLNSVQEADYSSKGDRIASLVSSLETHAEDTQTEVASVLAQESDSTTPLYSSTKSFWISNQVYIKDATVELLTKLLPLSTIAEIREEQVLPVPTIDADTTATNSTVGLLANEWGVTKINAPSVWDLGYNGKGVVVSSIDTGVLYTHTALKSNFRSSYGWYDPESETATPYDQQGHGTHTMGTMVGSGGIGVAPGAQWIACKGCRTDGCSESDLLTCAQFITCPTDTSGNNKDCSKAPDLVSNSWGGGQGDTFYDAAISAWRTAGIIPIFSIGNEGDDGCGTANSPGDNANVISVGATTSADALASYSSKGPSVNGLVKPEVSAPGSSVRSAWYTSTSAYNTIDGTSMACPHVSGTVALLLSAKPTLTYAQVKTAVTTTTSKTISSTGYTCGSTRDATIPNNQFGYGRLNALTAVQSVL